MRHVNIIVSGSVQGVGFRYYARAAAVEFGVAGFVANKSDGTVYLEAEGNPASVEKFVAWCRQGPPGAQVERVNVTDGPVQHFHSFEIAA